MNAYPDFKVDNWRSALLLAFLLVVALLGILWYPIYIAGRLRKSVEGHPIPKWARGLYGGNE